MGDLLREADDHPHAEIVGVCDPDASRMADAIANFRIPLDRVFHDVETCIKMARPDVVILCPATARTTQPQPKRGFVVVGSMGAISSYDYEDHVAVQTRDRHEIHALPVDKPAAPLRAPVEYVLSSCKETGTLFEGPLDPALCRTAQRIVDTAALSARERRTLKLLA